jgi:DNA modification methylase
VKHARPGWRKHCAVGGARIRAGRPKKRKRFDNLLYEEEMPLIWTLPPPGNDEKAQGKHPTQKPIAVVQRCLLASTQPGDLVLDPFLGGGTTAVAAVKTKRKCVGIESEPQHATLAVARVKMAIGSTEEMFAF